VSNGERVTSLYQAFRNAGINVDKEVFDDYLAIKYLRNTIVHGKWKQSEKEWLDMRGFPTDTRKLTKEHLDRIDRVSGNMMLYISLTTRARPTSGKPDGLIKLDNIVRPDDSGILRLRDIERIFWNALERIDARLTVQIKKAVPGPSRDDLKRLGHDESRRLFYLAARRLGKENAEVFAEIRPLANEALEFWREYWRRAVAPQGLSEESITRALQVFGSHDFQPELPQWSVFGLADLPDDLAEQLVDDALGRGGPFTSEQIVAAFRAGKLAYDMIPNITPIAMLTLRLPVIDPANTAVYVHEAQSALHLFRLNRAWYSCVEYHAAFTDESLDFYARIHQELTARR
jgi:hypothetical protein